MRANDNIMRSQGGEYTIAPLRQSWQRAYSIPFLMLLDIHSKLITAMQWNSNLFQQEASVNFSHNSVLMKCTLNYIIWSSGSPLITVS